MYLKFINYANPDIYMQIFCLRVLAGFLNKHTRDISVCSNRKEYRNSYIFTFPGQARSKK